VNGGGFLGRHKPAVVTREGGVTQYFVKLKILDGIDYWIPAFAG